MPISRRSVVVFALGSLALFGPLLSSFYERGIVSYDVVSEYQSGPTQIRTLLPDKIDPGRTYPVIYILPVEAQGEQVYGDPLAEVMRHNFHNKYQTIFVMPTFSATPWYADHPSDQTIRQDSYIIKTIVPFVEHTYPTLNTPEGRYLLGFSKSGWGAWTLLLRHPDVFGRALAWDAPMMMEAVGLWETPRIFGTQENFETYRLSDLVRTRGPKLGKDTRLYMIGYDVFRDDHRRMHELLTTLSIPHGYADGPQRKHDWRSGWIGDAVDLLRAVP